MDYKQFRETNSVSGKDMISALRELYPKYGKATQSMVDNPEKYGVRLLPAAERHLAERFVGEHDGHKAPNRRKPHRLVVYLPDDLYRQVRALIEEEFPGMPVAVCANLPYYITSPIVMKLLGDRLPIQNLTVMVQKEAADRLAAAPGTRASSAVSCAVSYYATSKLMVTAAPGSFYPAPKVTSAVVRMDIRPTPAVQVEDEDGYFALIRAAFGQRRKTAANAIANGLHLPKAQVISALQAAGLDERSRPEQLTLENYCALQTALANT